MARRRQAPKREYLKDVREHEADALLSTVTELLSRLYVPLMRAYPLGNLGDPATGCRMHEIMRACKAWCEAQDILSSIPPEMRKLTIGDAELSADRQQTVSTAIWLDTPALSTTTIPVLMSPDAWTGVSNEVRANWMAESSPRKTVTLLRTAGLGTIAGEYDTAGNRQLYKVSDRMLHPIEETEQVTQDLVQRKGVLVFLPPFKATHDLFNAKLLFPRISPEKESLPWPVSYMGPPEKQTFWLLPDNPYYKEMQLWAETAYQMYFIVQQHIRTYQFLHQTCTTVGQLKRVWPEVVTFAPPVIAAKLRAAEKASPMPMPLRPRSIGPHTELGFNYKARMARIQHQINELTEACVRAVLLPELPSAAKQVVNTFSAGSYYEQLPAPGTSIWNS